MSQTSFWQQTCLTRPFLCVILWLTPLFSDSHHAAVGARPADSAERRLPDAVQIDQPACRPRHTLRRTWVCRGRGQSLPSLLGKCSLLDRPIGFRDGRAWLFPLSVSYCTIYSVYYSRTTLHYRLEISHKARSVNRFISAFSYCDQ